MRRAAAMKRKILYDSFCGGLIERCGNELNVMKSRNGRSSEADLWR
jgi:hypothetical protein